MAGKNFYTYNPISRASGSNKKIQINADGLKITQENHDKLVQFLVKLCKGGSYFRNANIERWRLIDQEIAGHIVPSKEDQQRIRQNATRGALRTVDEIYQFAAMQLDELVTYLMGVYAPEGSMYSAITTKDKQNVANGLTSLMNNHARTFQHYRNMALAFVGMGKYNLGGWEIEWVEEKGPRIKGSLGGQADIELNALINSGNELLAVDPYNLLYDPAFLPVDVPKKGQFMGSVELIRPFTIKMLDSTGFYSKASDYSFKQGQVQFFESKPIIQTQFTGPGGAPTTNWDQFWSQKFYSDFNEIDGFDGTAIERVRMNCWLNPKDFGLGEKDTMQIWRFHMLGSCLIAQAEQRTNVHRRLPYGIGMPIEDGMMMQARTLAEALIPLQRFASAQMNMHQRASRKRLYGMTVYNRRVIPILDNEDLAGGKIPATPASDDFDIRKAIAQFQDAPDTTNTMNDVKESLNLMRELLPSVQPNQVASLERATKYQTATYVQGTNKRNQKIAKLIDDQSLDPTRRMQLNNVLQYQTKMTIINDQTGEAMEIDPDILRNTDIQFSIADGLRGLDKLSIVDSMHDVLNMLLQSQVARDYDVGAIIDYFLELQGDKFDFTQFKYKSPIDALPPEMKNLAFQLLQEVMQQQQAQQATKNKQNMTVPGQPGQSGAVNAAQLAALPQPGAAQ